MFDLKFLWVLLLQVLRATTESVVDCPPKTADTLPVKNCNFYCGQHSNGVWRMGYYVNGTECVYSYEEGNGICAQLEGSAGCHSPNDDDVKAFLHKHFDTSQKKRSKKESKKSSNCGKGPKQKKQKSPKDSSKKTKKVKKDKKKFKKNS
ncbi:uncharacterized protein LOC119454447 [Dermacentor silvarum]|uniref:uncharacterized protein LOC119454447 n=1 Tax=Dermacentor silvarum TaxID=543639 RepID=UPI00189A4F92|nr:uncharacterized protein LOC119454447 [Dermacentor silvarum]